MSEAVSAFAAYKGKTKAGNAKKNKSGGSPGTSGANKKTGGNAKATVKAAGGKKKINDSNNNSTKGSQAKAKVTVKTQANGNKPRSCPLPSAAASSSKSKAGNKLNPNEKITVKNFEKWSLYLFDNSNKLNAAMLKKKNELAEFLEKATRVDKEYLSDSSKEDSDDEEVESVEDSNEVTQLEYTMNSYAEDSDEDNDEADDNNWQDVDEGRESASDVYEQTVTKQATKAPKSLKRKSNEPSNATKAKKIVETDNNTVNAESTKASNRRTVGPITDTKSKGNKRRSSIAVPELATAVVAGTSSSAVASVKTEPKSPPSSASVVNQDSIAEGKRLFGWIMQPIAPEEFFDKYWEKNACLIKRNDPKYFKKLISFDTIDEMLINNHIEFTTNIDVTSYENGQRKTLNPEGRAMPPVVWSHYGEGCSIRLLNPHTFMPSLFALNTTLQEYFHCLVGANAYLTPPNSQGFAPHYDDIEAFVLQIEGRKRWKLYKPLEESDTLARVSSHNFKQSDLGKPIFDEVLEPGDILYFPRGTIHQACTEPGHHSLHITLSVYQKQAYADLLEQLMPIVLQNAIKSQLELRRGLPMHTFRTLGLAYSDTGTKERYDLQAHIQKLCMQYLKPNAAAIDSAVDQLAKKYQHEALPPQVQHDEHVRTVFGSRNHTNAKGECVCDYDIHLRTNVRLLRANIVRLLREDGDRLRVYYYADNAREYCKYEPNFIEIEPEKAASIETLIRSYPKYLSVSQLPMPDDDDKIELATALWERGLLMTEKPF